MPLSRIVLSTEQLEKIVSNLAAHIRETYKNNSNWLALVILEGARFFADDLLKKLDLPLAVQYLKANSYSGTYSSGIVKIDKKDLLKKEIRGKHILLIDDIYDTGLTLAALMAWVKTCDPASIRTCVLLEKRHTHVREISIDFLGAPVEDEFLIGYGLDYNGHYRDLPYIGVLSEALIEQNQ